MNVRACMIAVVAVSVLSCAVRAADPWGPVASPAISGTDEQMLEIASANGAIRIDTRSGSEIQSVFLTRVDGGTNSRFEIRALGKCDDSFCLSEPVSLGEGAAVKMIAMADLRGEARTISLYEENTGINCEGNQQCAPVLFFVTSHRTAQGESEYLSVVAAALRLEVLLNEMLANRTATGGFSTSSIELEAGGGKLLDISLIQSALPAPGDEDFRPGPPLSRTFRYNGRSYQVIEN